MSRQRSVGKEARRPTAPLHGDVLPEDPVAGLLRGLDPLSTPSLGSIEDRRTWTPSDPLRRPYVRPARMLTGEPSRINVASAPSSWLPTPHVGYEQAVQVVQCIRRKQRKEVLHALRKTGKGSGKGPKKRNWLSNIRCK